jgi:hypothetical protein
MSYFARQRNEKKSRLPCWQLPMSLNNIRLNPALLADMYRTSLVDTNERVQAGKKRQIISSAQTAPPDGDTGAKSMKPSAWKHLGEYKKNILFVVRYDDAPYLPDEN